MKPDGSGAYVMDDFHLGAAIVVSGRTFHIVDADGDSRALLRERFNKELGEALPIPHTYMFERGDVGHRGHSNKVSPDVGDMEDPVNGFYKRMPDTKGRFMEHGSNMLRFECEWRETGETFGDRRSFALQYYLCDDTIEILDKTSPYSQGGEFTKFCARQRLPRMALEMGAERVVTDKGGGGAPMASTVVSAHATARANYKFTDGPTVWPKFVNPITGKPSSSPSTSLSGGLRAVGGFPVLTSLVSSPDFITAGDLVCGGVISVFGRPLLVKTADPFTVAFGLRYLGIDQRQLFVPGHASVASDRALVAPHAVPRGPVGLPPFEGALAIGCEEETRMNASKIVPTYRAANNFDRFYQLAGKQLRFEAAMDTGTSDPHDAAREFVVSFFLEDDTMAIVEVVRDRKGAKAVRFLARGKWRNALAAPDRVIQDAVQGPRGDIPLSAAAQKAYDRVYSANGDKFGYADSFGGQGYSGGVYGKAERTGPGGTGVAASADIGIRDSITHTFVAPPPFFTTHDFSGPGATIKMHHLPGCTFILGRPDGFTEQWLAARESASRGGVGQSNTTTVDARNVYVPDSLHPVPNLPLECVGGDDDLPSEGGRHNNKSKTDEESYTQSCLLLARLLAGVLGSVTKVLEQSDKGGRGYAPMGVVLEALGEYGVAPPACPSSAIQICLAAHTIGTGAELYAAEMAKECARSTVHARRVPPPPPPPPILPGGGSPLSSSGRSLPRTPAGSVDALSKSTLATRAGLTDPFSGPHLNDFAAPAFAGESMVDYRGLFKAIQEKVTAQQGLQPRLDKLLPQLRAALLSSRDHLRRVFRDLDTEGKGVITFKEFRHLLLRHQLDVGLNDAQVKVLMRRFPLVSAAGDATDQKNSNSNSCLPLISFPGFVEVLLESSTLAPGEVEHFMDFIRGLRNMQPDSVGGTRTVPQVYPHTNKVSSWGSDMSLERFGIKSNYTAAPAPPPPPPSGPPGGEQQQQQQQQRAALASSSSHINARLASTHHASTAPAAAGKQRAAAAANTTPLSFDSHYTPPPPSSSSSTVDVVSALSGGTEGAALLNRLRSTFGTRRLELFRALTLYDTRRNRVLGVRPFLDALVSAGLKLSTVQLGSITRSLCQAASHNAKFTPHPSDVSVDYNSFLDTLFPTAAY